MRFISIISGAAFRLISSSFLQAALGFASRVEGTRKVRLKMHRHKSVEGAAAGKARSERGHFVYVFKVFLLTSGKLPTKELCVEFEKRNLGRTCSKI